MPTIPQLPVATSITNTDLFVLDQSGVTNSATASLVLNYISSNISITESQVQNLTTDLAGKLAVANNLSDLNNIVTARVNLGLPSLTNFQVWSGVTGNSPTAVSLVAGTDMTIVQTGSSFTFNATSRDAFSWSNITATSVAMTSNSGYVVSASTLCTLTLPSTSSIGDQIWVIGNSSGLWQIAQNSGQAIIFGNAATTPGVSGYLASTYNTDIVLLTCITANTNWSVCGGITSGITVN